MSARDFGLLANVFSEVYARERDMVAALRVVFAIDDAQRVQSPIFAPPTVLADIDAADTMQPRRLKETKLTRFRQAQLLLPFVHEVAQAHGLTAKQLTGGTRIALVSSVRHEAMWTLRKKTKASFPSIGMAMGGRHHTTVIHGIRAFEHRLATEPDLRARVLGEGKAA